MTVKIKLTRSNSNMLGVNVRHSYVNNIGFKWLFSFESINNNNQTRNRKIFGVPGDSLPRIFFYALA